MLTGINQAGFAGASTPASNCSGFTLRDFTVHNVARNSVSFVGARNGHLDKLLDYEIGTDWDPEHKIYNSAIAGDYAGVEFEVDVGEEYEVVEEITCTNLDMRNHRTIVGRPNAASVLNFSARANHCAVTNFRYEQEKPNTGQQSIVTVGGASNITLWNGVIEVKNADHTKGTVYGILLQGQNTMGSGVENVTIEHVAIDGPTVGIRISQGCKDIRIANNAIRNCYRTGLWLEAECHVTGNYFRDMGRGNWFVEAQASLGGVATCESNVLANTLSPNASAAFYFLTVKDSRLIANYNKCYGLSGPELNHFGPGADPISFLENKFGTSNDGLIGAFTWPTGVAVVEVSNTNVTPYTGVLVFPIEQAAFDFVKTNPLAKAQLKAYDSFIVSTTNAVGPPETVTFGYRLF